MALADVHVCVFIALTLQLGIGLGAAFLPRGATTPKGPAQTVLYGEMEGLVGYRVVSNLELLLLISAGGVEGGPATGTAQLGAAFRF